MAQPMSSVVMLSLFVLTFETYLCQTKLHNGLQQTVGSIRFPSEVIRNLPSISSNLSPRRSSASNSMTSMSNHKSERQSTLVAIPLYIRNTSPSKPPMLFDLLSASLAESSAKSRKLTDIKPKVSTQSSRKSIIETPKYHSYLSNPMTQRYQSQQSSKYNVPKTEQLKDEIHKQEQSEDYSEYGSTGYPSSQKISTSYTTSPFTQSPLQSQSSQSTNKILFPKSADQQIQPQTQSQPKPQEDGQKQTLMDFNSAFNGYGISKTHDTQTLYDALSQSYDSGSYNEKSLPKNTEMPEYDSGVGSASSYTNTNINTNNGGRDPYSSSNGLVIASSINNPSYTLSNNGGFSYGGRGSSYSNSESSGSSNNNPANGVSSYSNPGSGASSYNSATLGSSHSNLGSGNLFYSNTGLSYAPSYGSEGNNADLVSNTNSGSSNSFNSAEVGSSGISDDNSYMSTITNNFSPQSTNGFSSENANFESHSGSSIKPYRYSPAFYSQQNINPYTLPISIGGYGSGYVNTNTNTDNNNNPVMSYGVSSHGLGYNSQVNNKMNTLSSRVNYPNSQSVTSNTFDPSPQSSISNLYNGNSQIISTNNDNPNSQSLSINSGSNGLYSSSSNDDSSIDEGDCYDDKPSPSPDFTSSTSLSESQKQLTNSKSGLYSTTSTQTMTNYDADDLDQSKLDMPVARLQIVNLPVSVLKRLVGNGELALPSFQ